MQFKERKYRYYLPIFFSLVLLLGIWAGIKLAPKADVHHQMFAPAAERYNKVTDLINYIDANYVDSVSKEDLSEDAILGILEKLDPHIQYFPAEMLATFVPWLMLNRDGLVVLLHPETGDDLADHTAHAAWFGAILPLRLEAFAAHK